MKVECYLAWDETTSFLAPQLRRCARGWRKLTCSCGCFLLEFHPRQLWAAAEVAFVAGDCSDCGEPFKVQWQRPTGARKAIVEVVPETPWETAARRARFPPNEEEVP